jgi:hypothetical protein
MALHVFAGLAISLTIALVFYAPAFWGVEDKLALQSFWQERIKEITWGRNNPFNLTPFTQVFFRTPVLVLIFSVFGMVTALKNYQKSPLYSLLMIWVLIPITIPCFPHTIVYHNGLRHFFVFLVPFSLLATIGLTQAGHLIMGMVRVNGDAVTKGLAFFIIGINLWGIVETHPYQTTFFNAIAGGLKGAQERNIADSCDYWLNSYKEAGRWIRDNGVTNANVLAVYYSGTPPVFNTDLIMASIGRADLRLFRLPNLPIYQGRIAIPENTYVVLVPFDYLRSRRILLERSGDFQKVHTISRQGGEICTIFYKPRAS